MSSVKIDRLYVAYDTAEAVSFLALMADHVRQKKSFHAFFLGSSEKSLTLANCEENKDLLEKIKKSVLTLADFKSEEKVDAEKWLREAKLSKKSLHAIRDSIDPSIVIAGTASRIQKQFFSHFPQADRIAFIDNVYYDPQNPLFRTACLVVKSATHVFCPAKKTMEQFSAVCGKEQKYTIVGNPTLEVWTRKIQANLGAKEAILEKLGFTSDKPIVAFMDAYDSNPAVDATYTKIISPLFQELVEMLSRAGYQAIVQPHPKIRAQVVETPKLLAVCDFVFGFNSSTVFNSLALGKMCGYIIPVVDGQPKYAHFSIDAGYAPAIFFTDPTTVFEKLLPVLEKMKQGPKPDLFQLEEMPCHSIQKIQVLTDALLESRSKPKDRVDQAL